MGRGAWRATVPGDPKKSDTTQRLNNNNKLCNWFLDSDLKTATAVTLLRGKVCIQETSQAERYIFLVVHFFLPRNPILVESRDSSSLKETMISLMCKSKQAVHFLEEKKKKINPLSSATQQILQPGYRYSGCPILNDPGIQGSRATTICKALLMKQCSCTFIAKYKSEYK